MTEVTPFLMRSIAFTLALFDMQNSEKIFEARSFSSGSGSETYENIVFSRSCA